MRSQFGYHVIKTHRPQGRGETCRLEKAKPQLMTYLQNQKKQKEIEKLVKEMRAKAEVKVNLPEVPTPARGSSRRSACCSCREVKLLHNLRRPVPPGKRLGLARRAKRCVRIFSTRPGATSPYEPLMPRKSRKNVGLIGLGIIGTRVAAGLRAAGFQVFVWNRTPKPAPNFLGSPAEIAANSATSSSSSSRMPRRSSK